jgi:hypothetical protein
MLDQTSYNKFLNIAKRSKLKYWEGSLKCYINSETYCVCLELN